MSNFLFAATMTGLVIGVVWVLRRWLRWAAEATDIQIRSVWELKRQGPFSREPVYCKVVDVQKGWVRYRHLRRDKTEYEGRISGEDSVQRAVYFVESWKQVEVSHGNEA